MNRAARLICGAALLLAAVPASAQDVATTVARVAVTPLPRGQAVIDITTVTRHPAYLEPLSLKTPDGVRIVSSIAAPDNAGTCPRAVAAGTECRQTVRVLLDTGSRCHAAGDYEALFRVSCWPGTAASRCTPGAYPFNFKLGAESACRP